MKRLLITLVLAGALGMTAAALAAGHRPITEKVLGAASVAQPYTFQVQHPAVVAIVRSGTLSLYDSADPSCTAHRYPAGEGFTEQPGHVHLARNEGRKPAVVLVTYLGLKHGVNPDVPAAKPGNCPF